MPVKNFNTSFYLLKNVLSYFPVFTFALSSVLVMIMSFRLGRFAVDVCSIAVGEETGALPFSVLVPRECVCGGGT